MNEAALSGVTNLSGQAGSDVTAGRIACKRAGASTPFAFCFAV
jgi:hypothetical protein